MKIEVLTEEDEEIIYPESDGKPMSDNTKQFNLIVLIKEGLEVLFADNDEVFVAGDLLWYPVKGSPKIRQAPDVMVAIGRPKGDRGSYLQWKEEDIAPQVVFEILSPGNTFDEMRQKFAFYEQYGVQEYYLYDPDKNRLEGWAREAGGLLSIDQMNGWSSPLLGIKFELSPKKLKIYDPQGNRFRSLVELSKQAKKAEAKAEQAEAKAEQAEAKAEQAEAKAEQEAQKRIDTEKKLQELQALLQAKGITFQ
ncbi:MAG: Uma2 family endonuclease [Microscillaceae bacterium]|jgi:Uma2 family endonuclease|nr:Uma2 family endonuclease [Microscillaceae bacterium]